MGLCYKGCGLEIVSNICNVRAVEGGIYVRSVVNDAQCLLLTVLRCSCVFRMCP